MRNLLLFSIFFLFAACNYVANEESVEAVQSNERSYHERYINIDSTLFYANRAESLSKPNSDSWVESQLNKAFVEFQQMDFDKALELLSRVEQTSRNQFHRLEAHILYMKIAQRVGDGESFFTHRNRALHILNRIQEGYETITDHYIQLVNYASSELHIVASTYYYYLGLDSAAVSEIAMAYEFVKDARDTAQWLNYNYMLGSGGLIVDKPENVILREFEHLFLTYTMAKAKHYIYFEANALQSLASMLSDSVAVDLILREQVGSYSFLQAQYASDNASDSLSFALAQRAIELFEKNKDAYQTACAYRTLGELYFSKEDYVHALDAFQYALSIVEEQTNKSRWTINPWMAGIREKLSMTYSALGDKYQSDLNRNIYLDLLDQYRQNYESETRLQELRRELRYVGVRTGVLFVVILLTAFLAFVLMKRMKSHSRNQIARLTSFSETEQFKNLSATADEICQAINNEAELETDGLNLSQLHIENYKTENAERRAKVSMVYSIIPYLDRMMSEVRKMLSTDSIEPERLHYVGELADEIMRINEILTDWIKMSQGSLSLHITTFPIQDIINVIALSRLTFEQKNIHLTLPETDVQVKADKALTLFMVNTLADNARKYTPSGGEVKIDVLTTDEYVEVSVSDTGIGLSDEECRILNDNKVYDASSIGKSDQPKGFGFGIMNCKGIINKYRKTSSLFNVCSFGVTSQLDQGSRFWFRLPRVLSMLLMLFTLLSPIDGQTVDEYETIYDSLYQNNIEGRHDEVLRIGKSFMENLTTPFDTTYVVLIENEIAVAALAKQDWDLYRRSNAECVRLHKLFTQDKSIVAYCDRMQQLHDNGIFLYLMLILFAIAALVLFYMLFLRQGLRSRRFHESLSEILTSFVGKTRQAILRYSEMKPASLIALADSDLFETDIARYEILIDNCVKARPQLSSSAHEAFQKIVGCYRRVRESLDHLFQTAESHNKASFEEDRFYVMNQILDNSLSTIKHETMYYPARARQLVDIIEKEGHDVEKLQELNDLLRYYRDVYLILYNQAERQLEQNSFRRQTLALADIIAEFTSDLQAESNRRNQDLNICMEADSSLIVHADRSLLMSLLRSLVQEHLSKATSLLIRAEQYEGEVLVTLLFEGLHIKPAEADEMFSPSTRSIPALVARQIIREHDAHCGMPGLRLFARQEQDGLLKAFTLKNAEQSLNHK